MKPMVAYIRVSTGKQVESGLSLEAQEQKIRAMAVVKGTEIVEVVVDAAESAKDLKRPGVQRVLAMIRSREVSGIIVAKLDRLTRSVRDLAALLELFDKKDAALVSVAETLDTSTATGRMVMHLIATVGQWEREIIAERTREALKAKRVRGERAGNVPFGFVSGDGGVLRKDPGEQAIIDQIKEMRGAGRSLRDIADTLNAAGLKTRRGTEWKFQYVANVLTGVKR